MINDTLKTWEREYGDARHRENTEKIDKLNTAFNRMSGAVWGVGGLVTFAVTAFKIYEAMK